MTNDETNNELNNSNADVEEHAANSADDAAKVEETKVDEMEKPDGETGQEEGDDSHDEVDSVNPYKEWEWKDLQTEIKNRKLNPQDKKRAGVEAALIADDAAKVEEYNKQLEQSKDSGLIELVNITGLANLVINDEIFYFDENNKVKLPANIVNIALNLGLKLINEKDAKKIKTIAIAPEIKKEVIDPKDNELVELLDKEGDFTSLIFDDKIYEIVDGKVTVPRKHLAHALNMGLVAA